MHTSAMECSHLILNHEQHLSAGKESSKAACVLPPLKMQWQDVPCLHCSCGHHDVDTLYTIQVDTMMWTVWTLLYTVQVQVSAVGVTRCLSVNTDISAPNLQQYAAH